jgi:alpha-tubulin suppressor-like RCC1 family protein
MRPVISALLSGGETVAFFMLTAFFAALPAAAEVANFDSPTVTLTMAVTPASSGTTIPAAGTSKVTQGAEFTITAAAAAGYKFYRWTVSGGAAVEDDSSQQTSAILASDGTITANFAKQLTLTMAVSPASSGATTPAAGASQVYQYDETSICATPAAYYQFSYWGVTGGASVADTAAAETEATLTANGTVTAYFAKVKHTLTMAVSPASSGTTTPQAGASQVDHDTAVSITATAAANYKFSYWTAADGAAVASTSSASTTAKLTSDGAVTAIFSRIQSELTMAVSPASSGATTPAAGKSTVYQGDLIPIAAVPAAYYQFSSWTVSSGATVASTSSASTTAKLTSTSGTVTANFTKVKRALTMVVSPAAGGSTAPAAGTSQVDYGTAVSVKATAATNYQFSYWTAAGGATLASTSGASTTATLTANGTVTAFFTKIPRTLTLAVNPASAGATVPSALAGMTVGQGDATAIFACPAAGYVFSSWNAGTGAAVDSSSMAGTTATLSASGKVTANFKAVDSDVSWAWGDNSSGQLGINSGGVKSMALPGTVTGDSPLSNVCQLAAGDGHSLALKSDGTVWAWGSNSYGQLGNGSTGDAVAPVQVRDISGAGFLSGIYQLAAGGTHSMALKYDGTVFAWGDNGHGQLGVNSTVSSALPVQVLNSAGTGGLSGVSQLAAGSCHSLALTAGGRVFGWGENYYGQLGNNTRYNDILLPVPALDSAGSLWLEGVARISAGVSHSLAVMTNGSALAWGCNDNGQLGDNTKTTRVLPVQVLNSAGAGSLSGVSQLSAGGAFSLAVTTGGAVYAWGDNSKGTLGNNSTISSLIPVQVKNSAGTGYLSGISQVSARNISLCLALSSGGAVYAWGSNYYGQIGIGTWGGETEYVKLPAQVKDNAGTGWLSGISQISAGKNHSMALRGGTGYLRLTTAVSGNGTISPLSGVSMVMKGASSTVSAAAAPNWRFLSWTVSGGAAVADPSSASTTAVLVADGGAAAKFIPTPVNDFNSDGKSDLLFRYSDGTTLMYYMDGTSMKQYVYPSLGAGESPVEIGDFNGDGYFDILTRNQTSDTVSVYLMRSGSVISSGVLLSGASDWRIMGAADFNGDGKTDIIWQNRNSAQAVIYIMDGVAFSCWGIVYDGADHAWRVMGAGDINGDGKADIIWRNSSSGQVIGYLMDGLTMTAWGSIYNGADKSWIPVGFGDLDGDGKTDIIWRNSSSGQVIGYLMDGLVMKSWGSIYNGSDPNLCPAAFGDFNGDGMCDIALRNSFNGNVLIYLMNGLAVSSQGYAYSGADPNWDITGCGEALNATLTMALTGFGALSPSAGLHSIPLGGAFSIRAVPATGYRFAQWTVSGPAVVAAPALAETTVTLASDAAVTAVFKVSSPSDFNGDIRSDLLWRNSSNGYVASWLMSGAQAIDAKIIFDSDTTWVPVGKGDFDGDGKCDILWQRSSTGAAVIWYMNGVDMRNYAMLSASASYSIIAVGDFNGDGYADILWRSSPGAVFMDLIQGSSVIGSAKIFEAGTAWIPCAAGDFNGDGKCDILWRDSSNGNVAMWLMNGLTVSDARVIFNGDGVWAPVRCGDFNGDGKWDISWQSSAGTAVLWLMSGFTTLSSGYVYTGGDSAWQIADAGDYDGDSLSDIVWRNSVSGQTLIYFMDGLTVKRWVVIFEGDPSWTVVGNK